MSEAIYLEHTDVGATLTTWLYVNFWQMFAAEKLGYTSYIHWPRDKRRALHHYFDDKKFDEEQNMYDWYFRQPHHALVPPPREKVWCWTDPASPGMGEALGQHQLYADVKTIKEFFKKNLIFQPWVDDRGLELVKKYDIDFANTIGITWRGTDSVMDGRPRLPIEVYFPFIDQILTTAPYMRIACTAEEEGILDLLLRRYPTAFKIEEFLTAPTIERSRVRVGDNPERFCSRSGFERGMQPALMVWLFSKCKHYVKNRSSVAAVASWLSTGRIVSIAHPENMGHDEESKKLAEIDGIRIPLNAKGGRQ